LNEPTHIIQKVFLEVNTGSEETANLIKYNADYFLKDVLLWRLEELLNDYDATNSVVRFEELHLDFFIPGWKNEREIVMEFESNLKKQLEKELPVFSENAKKSSSKNREIPAAQNRKDVFLFFLDNGFLPWYGKESYINELIKINNWREVIHQKVFREKLTILLNKNEIALTRFVLQFPLVIVTDYLVVLQSESKGLEKEIRSLLGVFSEKVHSQLLQILLQLSVLKENEKIIQNLYSLVSSLLKTEQKPGKPQSEKAFRKLKDLISEYFPAKKDIEIVVQTILEKYEQNKLWDYMRVNPDLKNVKQQDEKETDDSFFEEKTSEINVQNAGLVLLHPFLKTLFTETGILDKKEHLSAKNQTLAIQTLHYVATGNEEFFEANMIFEKYLVGVSLKMPVPRESMLTNEMKSEANEMLREVIKNWPALKNTSPDELREMFLQREGKLLKAENGFKLIVERKTQDILLDRLNWNIAIIKLKWLEKLLFVEW